MHVVPVEGVAHARVQTALAQSPLFASLTPEVRAQLATRATLHAADAGAPVVNQGDPSDAFFVLVAGEVSVHVRPEGGGAPVEISRLGPPESLGEAGLLLRQPQTATIVTVERALLLRFDEPAFRIMCERIPGFGLAMSRSLAARLASASRQISMLGVEHFAQAMASVASVAGNAPVAVGPAAPVQGAPPSPGAPSATSSSSPRLDALLRRLVAEGGSDLHISGRQQPRWRVDGEMREIADVPALRDNEVYELLEPVMEERSRAHFKEDNDADFAYAIEGLARFRVNLFRDKGGVGAVMRVIPAKILTFDQLNLPPVCQKLCENPKGLVLVTGPTGSGKSTTLAAMIDWINKNRKSHIITLEDPIEFVHQSRGCMINQREVGPHTKSFHRALKAALREDPDIVLVGEMRDLETVSLALETANTGHLVFGTLHTATAISTVDRIIDLFPTEQQNQVRAVLADTLKGVVAQTLCRKIGGGRVAALEILVSSFAIANLIREGKTHQIVSSMSTSRAAGNVLLNDALAALVAEGKVDYTEALGRALDKADLARRCNKPPPGEDKRVAPAGAPPGTVTRPVRA